MSISQTVTQLMAPPQIRGQVIGVYNMTAQGLRIGSGFTVGLMAGVIGASWARATSSAGLIVGTAALIVVIWRGRRRAAVSAP
jgi:hypothetical protein